MASRVSWPSRGSRSCSLAPKPGPRRTRAAPMKPAASAMSSTRPTPRIRAKHILIVLSANPALTLRVAHPEWTQTGGLAAFVHGVNRKASGSGAQDSRISLTVVVLTIAVFIVLMVPVGLGNGERASFLASQRGYRPYIWLPPAPRAP